MSDTRQPLKKHIPSIPIEQAHGGSGSRQLLLSSADPISSNVEAWTKGYLPAGASFEWHGHVGIDEAWIVLKGTGFIEYEDGTKFDYAADDLFNNPAELKHRIVNTGNDESVFYFVRVKA